MILVAAGRRFEPNVSTKVLWLFYELEHPDEKVTAVTPRRKYGNLAKTALGKLAVGTILTVEMNGELTLVNSAQPIGRYNDSLAVWQAMDQAAVRNAQAQATGRTHPELRAALAPVREAYLSCRTSTEQSQLLANIIHYLTH